MANRFSIGSDATQNLSAKTTGIGTVPFARCPNTFLRCVFFLIMVAGPFSGMESARSAPFPARGYHTAVWTGNEMIVWGGFNGSYLKDGARYNPAANRWTAVAPNALATRYSHAAVWTGNEMIIWGGGAGSTYFNNGARYDPVTDNWTAMSAHGAASLRIAPAVWTGTEMIVWGGYNGSVFLNDGGRYNPMANAWTATTNSVAPSARNGLAVWTGREMIVWGGGFNTGGRYDPVANSWIATTNSGAPVARSSHATVWTGRDMIVWGGFGIGVQNSGGIYNPAANSWAATTTNSAPSTRYNHTAVWTGSEMIVWGGFGSSAFNNGGRYNPQSNSWTAIANDGAPSPRYYHTAVWTGSEMIVWGGYNGSIYMNDGGRYNPVTDTWTSLPASTPCRPGFPDDFSCRETLSGSNLSFSVSNVGATIEPGEPSHFVDPSANPAIPEAGASLWYSWTAPFSGGAVITSTSTNNNYFTPCLAVYTGNSLSNLSRIATNVSSYSLSRVAFNAAQGSNYLVAVAGVAYLGSSGTGGMNVHLALSPPPENDLFANRNPAASLFYETSGSFVGASREPGEPAHTNSLSFPSWPQTLWWKWTAPTDLEVPAVPVKLTADGIGFTPNIGVYTGPSVSNLATVVVNAHSGGIGSHVAGFQAEPGTTYQIALGGRQHDPKIGSTQFGEFQFRLNVRALVLSSGNLNFTNNFSDYTVAFGANLQVTNLGSADSAPLRVRVTAILGSVLTAGAVPTSSAQVLLLTTNLPALSSGQGVVRRINGIVPPPSNDANTNETGYGVYAELQEQGAADWSTIDQAFILNGIPTTSIISGGGVVMLDAGLSGQTFNPLTNVSILGPLSVNEGTRPAYTGRARFASGSQQDFTNTVWTSTRFSITNGVLKAGSVISNTPVGLTAKYSSGGFIHTAATNVVVLDRPPPRLELPFSSAGNFGLRIDGVAGRLHVIESANALSNATVWLPLTTNALDSAGLWNFSEPIGTNRQRFYRAREAE